MADTLPQDVKGYEIREQIGKGGFGAVYRAYQAVVGREVAIKVILPLYANQPDFIRRFETEAQLVARLEHPHIVPLFEYWRDTNGAYLVMRFLRAGSLRQRIHKNPLEPQYAVQIINQVASALALAHRNGIIHRDVKPHNIMLDDEGNAYLTDFGIALSAANERGRDEEEFFTGSPSYAAPEIIMGQDITPQADIYALGIVMYEMLTGHHPFDEESFTTMIFQQLNQEVPPLPPDLHLHPDVYEVLKKATDKDPNNRYATVSRLAAAFRGAIMGGDTSSITGTHDVALIKNPYKGLLAFQEADTHDFFGREELITEILDRLREKPQNDSDDYSRFLAVVGPSGSGKSSVVQAGVIPSLRDGALNGSDQWFVVQIEPDDKPIANIVAALLSIARTPPPNLEERLRSDAHSLTQAIESVMPEKNSELLFVIDNFEELFTLTEDDDERIQYLQLLYNALMHPQSRLRVMIMMRADYYDKPLLYENFGALMQERTQLVLPLGRTEIERAIKSPAERVGLQVDRDFLEAIVADIRDEPGALPLLQYALTETFNKREGRRLTLASYRATGGVYGALSRRAEEVYEQLAVIQTQQNSDIDLQDLARQIFLRLVSIEDTGNKRRRASRYELVTLGDPQAINAVLDEFGKYRLFTFEGELGTREPKVEIAHEALIREWERLQTWLEASREDLRVERLLSNATDEWMKAKNDNSYLVTGARLAQLEEWANATEMVLTQNERKFLDASIAVREATEHAEQARQERELHLAKQIAETSQRAAQRLRLFVAGLAVLLGVAIVLFGVALTAQQTAETQRRIADRKAQEAQSLQLAFNAQVELLSGRPELALALALNAVQIENPPPSIGSVLVETAYIRATNFIYSDHTAPVMAIAISPDGQTMLTAGGRYNENQQIENDTLIRLWDVNSHTLIRTFAGHTDTVWSLAFSPDGKTFASGSADTSIRIWNIDSGTQRNLITGHTQDVRSVQFSSDGTQLLSGSGAYSNGELTPESDFSVRLWRISDGTAICTMQPVTPLGSEVRTATFSPDNTQVLSASGAEYSATGDNAIVLWDVATCQESKRIYGHNNIVQDVRFSPNGRQALSASADNSVILWDLLTGEKVRTFVGHTDWVNRVAFDATGQYAISGGWDNTVILWNVDSGRLQYQYAGHTAPIQSLAFGTDGRKFFSGSQDTDVREWDAQSVLFVQAYGANDSETAKLVRFSPDEKLILTVNESGLIALFNRQRGTNIGAFRGHQTRVYAASFSQNGERVLSSDADGQVILWQVTTRQELRRFSGHEGIVWSASFSPDERTILTGSDDSTVRVWDVNTGEQLWQSDDTISEVYTVGYALDGKTFFASTLNGDLVVWDATTRTEISRSEAHIGGALSNTVSADGKYWATGGYDNTVILWDAQTGKPIRTLSGHFKTVIDVAFSADSRTLITGSFDRTVRFWDVATGVETGRINYGVALVGTTLSKDGQLLAVAADDARVTTYRLPILALDELIVWIRANRYVYALSCEERVQYNVAPLCASN
jgi:WD40 repeat protein/serine/threonine protein kinase